MVRSAQSIHIFVILWIFSGNYTNKFIYTGVQSWTTSSWPFLYKFWSAAHLSSPTLQHQDKTEIQKLEEMSTVEYKDIMFWVLLFQSSVERWTVKLDL